MAERFRARYRVETPCPLERAAQAMAGEQSTGTFVALPGETESLLQRHAARVEAVLALGETDRPALPGAQPSPGPWHQGEVTLSWPLENVGPSIANLMATVLGNLTELREVSGLRLVGLDLPPSFVEAQPGPQFGVPGTRRLSGVEGRPLIGTIVKPSVGLTPEETGRLAGTLAEAGLDFIKDDELIADPPYSPVEARVAAVMPALRAAADRSGRLCMYAFNITGTLDEMRRRHDAVVAAGGSCVMVSLNWVGLAGLEALRRHAVVPIHGHRNGWGALSRFPLQGMDFPVFQMLWRLMGADHIHVNGLSNKFSESDASVLASARACLAPLLEQPGRDDRIMPVFSSAQTVMQVHDTWAGLGSTDLIHAAGGGILAHPQGVSAGCRALQSAWAAAAAGVPLAIAAREDPALAAAVAAFGPRARQFENKESIGGTLT